MSNGVLDMLGEVQRMALMSLLNGGVARNWPRHKPVMADLELAGLVHWGSVYHAKPNAAQGRWELTLTGRAAAERQLERWLRKRAEG